MRYCLTCGREAEYGKVSGLWWCAEGHYRETAARDPFKIRRDGTVEDRASGKVCGRVRRLDEWGHEWEATGASGDEVPMPCGMGLFCPMWTRQVDAARALWEAR